MDDRDKWPSVVNEQFTQAWINLKELPGGMMQSNQPPYRYGPIPGTQSCLITTSPREADLWRARGDAVLTICTCGVALPEVPRYRCGHCGYEGPCSGNGYSAPWCKQCQRNDRLTPVSGVRACVPHRESCPTCGGPVTVVKPKVGEEIYIHAPVAGVSASDGKTESRC